ncbi:MAG: DUF4203 domain-containing protein [Candidatus Sumerlaeota bacterium]|nr:DUF4203 domain-containing protein [Candidatus Sumerlaeota bacterium]
MAPPPDWLLVAAGAALCLFGWALYWAGIHVVGAATGAGLAVLLVSRFIGKAPLTGQEEIMLALAALIGVILGVFALRRLHFGALALMGAMLGLLFGYEIALVSDWQGSFASVASSVVGGLVGAGLFIFLHRQIIILTTAIFGATLISNGLNLHDARLLLLIVPVSWMVQFGVVTHLGLSLHHHEEEEEAEKKD